MAANGTGGGGGGGKPRPEKESDLRRQTTSALKRGARSIDEKIELHKDKIKNPGKYYNNWATTPERRKAGAIRKWKHEIVKLTESKERHIAELERRGEKYDG